MKKGLTLIEVILSITLISIIAMYFLPGITFGYKNLIESKKFTEDIFASQLEIEKLMEEKRKQVPVEAFDENIFGVTVEGHNIEISVEDHGEIHVFQTEKKYDYEVPKIIKNVDSGLTNIVRLSAFINSSETLPVPTSVNMFTGSNLLDSTRNFLVDSKYYKIENPKIHLVSIYRWYTSSMVDYSADFKMDNYFIIKEWNAARPLYSYEESKTLKTIPNIQNDPDYNRLTFTEIKTGLGLNDTALINQYGNRYYYFSITPFAISGKIGEEVYSNAIYINAPRIEIEKAVYGPNDNQVSIYFKDNIKNDEIIRERMSFNASLGNVVNVSRDTTNNKLLIIEFDNTLDQDVDTEGNILHFGAVQSEVFGEISIWYNGVVESEFTIYDVPPILVESVSLSENSLNLTVDLSEVLTATVNPYNATNKDIAWSSSDTSVASVSETGDYSAEVSAHATGTAVITVTTADGGKKATCTVTVTEVPTEPEDYKENLILHLDASNSDSITTVRRSSTNYVTEWADLSGYGNHFTQGTSFMLRDRQPSLLDNGLNDMAVVSFNGDDYLTLGYQNLRTSKTNSTIRGQNLFTNNNEFSIFIVAKATNTSNNTFLSKASGWNYQATYVFGRDGNNFRSRVRGTQMFSVTANNNFNLHSIIVSTANTNSYWLNGENLQSRSVGTYNTVQSQDIVLGATNSGSSDRLNGEIAEVRIYNKALTSEQRTLVENYLKYYWLDD